MRAPTDAQRAVLVAMNRATCETGVPPTIRELAAGYGTASVNCVFGHVKALERRGLVSRVGRGLSRNLRITPAGYRLLHGYGEQAPADIEYQRAIEALDRAWKRLEKETA